MDSYNLNMFGKELAVHRNPKDRLEFRLREPLHEIFRFKHFIEYDIRT